MGYREGESEQGGQQLYTHRGVARPSDCSAKQPHAPLYGRSPLLCVWVAGSLTVLLPLALPTVLQVEMDFKAECTAGDQIDCFGMPLTESAGSNGCKQQFLHLLRKGGTDTEVWRARTTWTPLVSSGSNSSSTAASVLNGAAAAAPAPVAAVREVSSNGKAAAAASHEPVSSSSSSRNGSTSNGAKPADSSSEGQGSGGGIFGALAALFGNSKQ